MARCATPLPKCCKEAARLSLENSRFPGKPEFWKALLQKAVPGGVGGAVRGFIAIAPRRGEGPCAQWRCPAHQGEFTLSGRREFWKLRSKSLCPAAPVARLDCQIAAKGRHASRQREFALSGRREFWKLGSKSLPPPGPVARLHCRRGGALCEAAAPGSPGRIRAFWKARILEAPLQRRAPGGSGGAAPLPQGRGVVRSGGARLAWENSRFLEGENSGRSAPKACPWWVRWRGSIATAPQGRRCAKRRGPARHREFTLCSATIRMVASDNQDGYLRRRLEVCLGGLAAAGKGGSARF